MLRRAPFRHVSERMPDKLFVRSDQILRIPITHASALLEAISLGRWRGGLRRALPCSTAILAVGPTGILPVSSSPWLGKMPNRPTGWKPVLRIGEASSIIEFPAPFLAAT